MGLATPASAATPLSPPPRTDAIAVNRLPTCQSIKSTPGTIVGSGSVALERAATLLGWTNTTGGRAERISPSAISELAPMIPCRSTNTAGNDIFVPTMEYRLSGTTTGSLSAVTNTYQVTCSTSTGTLSVINYTDTVSMAVLTPTGQSVSWTGFNTAFSRTTCPFIVSINLTTRLNSNSSIPAALQNTIILTGVWRPTAWVTDNGGWSGATSDLDLIPDGIELPIICTIDNSGADLFELIGNVIGSMIEWPGCMLIPRGWDRAGLIESTWSNGATGETQSAFDAAIPNGIACGSITLPAMPGHTASIDTCTTDMAPLWIKSVINGIVILGLLALAVKRIMWSVGSKG